VIYVSRVTARLSVCGEVEVLFRSCPGVVVVSMERLVVVPVMPFVVPLLNALLLCL